jgi:hypothetical protein
MAYQNRAWGLTSRHIARSFLKTMLSNETYLGLKYYNQMRVIRQYANPIYGIEHSTKKNIKRGREEWIGINIPAIISRELFDRVQKRLEDDRKHYRNPREPQLLSNLVKCGVCGSSGFALRRWEASQQFHSNDIAESRSRNLGSQQMLI